MISPFHEGEQRIQDRLGVREEIEPWARRVVRPFLPEDHQAFYAELPFLVAAARDARGRPWATLFTGEPGFARAPDARTLRVDAAPLAGDALEGALTPGADLGLLGIELHSRRRNRVNGRVSEETDRGLALAVEQSFGNCPQYISVRRWQRAESHAPATPQIHSSLPARLRHFVARADTFFIASGHRGEGENPAFGMDASHRGGEPGFVRVEDDRTFVFPDYAGNRHFNTLGNLLLDPRAGLLFVDFDRGDLLQLTGSAEVIWDRTEVSRIPGAQRIVRFHLEEAVELGGALPLRWEHSEPELTLRVAARVRESEDVTSFVFEAADGSPLPAFTAGQHLPIEVDALTGEAPLSRSYSLSGSPGDPRYRISVKREPQGVVSRHLHDRLGVGDPMLAREPAGDSTLGPSADRPLLLVGAGVGVTPLVSMLHAVVEQGSKRAVLFVQAARDGAHHPLGEEIRRLAAHTPGVHHHVAYSRPRPEDVAGRDYHSAGRVDLELLRSLALAADAEVHLCGPPAFMSQLARTLEDLGVDPAQIHVESFGPAV